MGTDPVSALAHPHDATAAIWVAGKGRYAAPLSEARGLLHNKLRFETYPPVGTFPRGWYVYRVDGVDGPEEMERN